MNENCLGIKNSNNNYDPVTWPVGSAGSFALNGNHEMYANGDDYLMCFLPRLGLRAPGGMTGQQTSFFCLQNEYWRMIAIDTGYNSIGVPILSGIPWINRIPGIGGDCGLHPIIGVAETDGEGGRGSARVDSVIASSELFGLSDRTRSPHSNCGMRVYGGTCCGSGGMSIGWRGTT